jgi:hypothetical protein
MAADLTQRKLKTTCKQVAQSSLGTCLKEGKQVEMFSELFVIRR